jgi:hypothetical protein
MSEATDRPIATKLLSFATVNDGQCQSVLGCQSGAMGVMLCGAKQHMSATDVIVIVCRLLRSTWAL